MTAEEIMQDLLECYDPSERLMELVGELGATRKELVELIAWNGYRIIPAPSSYDLSSIEKIEPLTVKDFPSATDRKTKHQPIRLEKKTRRAGRQSSIHIGDRFGLLTVESFAGYVGKRMIWSCRCDCGNTILRASIDLKRHEVPSCGCMRKRKEV